MDRLRSARKDMTISAEALAQRVAERAIDLVLQALDINELIMRVDINTVLGRIDLNGTVLKNLDMNALLERVDVNELLQQVDVDAVLDRVDLNEVVSRIDMERIVEQTDLGAIIARSTGGLATEVLDTARSGAVGLDQFIDRWVMRLLRRKQPRPLAPHPLPDAGAQP
jgi:hypothetical protein